MVGVGMGGPLVLIRANTAIREVAGGSLSLRLPQGKIIPFNHSAGAR